MSRRLARLLALFMLIALLVGTQMPGRWRAGIEGSVHAPFALSSWAHFAVFAGLAWVLSVKPLCWPAPRIFLTALALAVVTEGLQFFAVDRHPRLTDIAIDMSGTVLALLLAKCLGRRAD